MLLTIKKLTSILNVSRSTLHRLRYTKHFPKPMYMGARSPRWDEREIEYWCTAHAPNLRKHA